MDEAQTDMTRAEAIRAARQSIEAGSWPGDTANVFGSEKSHYNAWLAFGGSLDAAKALHEAVLSGWRAEIWQTEEGDYGCNLQSEDDQLDTEFSDMMARAWLLAVLAALEAMEDG